MFIQAVLYDRTLSVFRSKTLAGCDLCWDYIIQWWRIRIRAGIKEKVKVRTKYTLTIYSLEIVPISANICPFQQYLSCYWPDSDLTFWTQLFGGLNFYGLKFFLDQSSFGQLCFWPEYFQAIFYTPETFVPKIFWTQIFHFFTKTARKWTKIRFLFLTKLKILNDCLKSGSLK